MRAFLMVERDGGPGGCATRVRLIFAGWLPQDRVSPQSPPSRVGCHRPVWSAAHSCVTDALARRAGAAAPLDQRVLSAAGQSAVATAQQKPASSRAAATAMMVRRLWRCCSRFQTPSASAQAPLAAVASVVAIGMARPVADPASPSVGLRSSAPIAGQ
jgi:hypothetical protein